MQSQPVTTGRRVLVVLEPGDEVLSSLATACRAHGITQALVVTFSGAFRSAELIAGETAPEDPELPSAEVTSVAYTEGIGSGTITSEHGEYVVHLHVALGDKSRAAAARAGHLLRAETHYVVEIALDEILEPSLARRPHPGSSGVGILAFDSSGEGSDG